jgi:uncharacterized protein YcfJ
MKTPLCALCALVIAAPAMAQDYGRVLSSTPIITQATVPQQVCNMVLQPMPARTSGAGALMGAIAGGAVGQAIGHGNGRAAATAVGIVGGAVLGDRLEAPEATPSRTVRHCHTQYLSEQRVSGYQVRYEFGGREYVAQMPSDPGPWVRLQVSPLGASPLPAAPAVLYQTLPETIVLPTTATVIESRTVYVQTAPHWHRHRPPPPPAWRGPEPMRRHHGPAWR